MRGVLVLLVIARVASADEIDDLVVRGEDLARQAEWSRAIDAFKAADAQRPRAKHACLIGLAYTRRELWAEAELFLSICRQRARADDPAPDWLDEAQRQLSDKLAAANAAAVTITVDPADALAAITVSSFAPGETFTPRTIHLAPGSHVITVTAPGYRAAKQDVEVTSSAAKDVRIHLVRDHADTPPPAGAQQPSRVPLYLLVAGGALAAGGLAYDQLALQPARDRLTGATTNAQYEANEPTYQQRRDVTLALWAGAAVVAATGVVLHFTVFREREPVRVGAAVAHGGGVLTLEWRR